MRKILFMALLVLIATVPAFSQTPLTTPAVSQQASISQRIGLTDITVEYHRPGINGREVWGGLVPFDQVWRAGANQNTTLSFSTPVSVEGQEVPAGKYGVHMIPTTGDWTVILSKESGAWGSFSYDESEDALRVQVKPESHATTERLTYAFDNPEPSSVDLALTWGDKRVPIHLEVDLAETLVASAAAQLRGLPRFSWQGWNQAAAVAVQVGDLEQASTWVDRSIAMNRNFTNLQTKAQILEGQGQSSDALNEESMAIATEAELNAYGYRQLFAGNVDAALEAFVENTRRHPESWNVWDSLAEAQAGKGMTSEAIVNYTKALEMTELEAQKDRIRQTLETLKAD